MIGLLELHGSMSNLYACNCCPVQEGFLKGIDSITRELVEDATLERLADAADAAEETEEEVIVCSVSRGVQRLGAGNV